MLSSHTTQVALMYGSLTWATAQGLQQDIHVKVV